MRKTIFILMSLALLACSENKTPTACEPMPQDVMNLSIGVNVYKHPLEIYSFNREPDRVEDDGQTCHEIFVFSGNVDGVCRIYEVEVDCVGATVQGINSVGVF